MRIIVHDFSGHPFQAQLARSLGARGHEVLHVQCEGYVSGKGSFRDEGSVRFEGISLGIPFERYRLRKRVLHEIRYARLFCRTASRFRPDVVVSCNDPLIAKAIFGVWALVRRVPWVFWLQDLYSIAMAREAERRSPVGRAVGWLLTRVERWLLHRAGAVVAITDDFDEQLGLWGIDRSQRVVIENWAPIEELPVRPRLNAWREAAGLGEAFVYLYSGTLGLKHNPDLLYQLAVADPDALVVVVSEGLGADSLRARLEREPIPNLRLLPYQPWDALPDMLGAADVLLAILEVDAGRFAVPSKILTYLCAGRPVVAAMPAVNLGARTILRAEAGIVVDPDDADALMRACTALRGDEEMRMRMGGSARRYAEATFDIGVITDEFEAVLKAASA